MYYLQTDEELLSHALDLFPDADREGIPLPGAASMRLKWVAAVNYLRKSGRGWALDKEVAMKVDRPLLHGYVATPGMVTHTQLPEEQIVPSVKGEGNVKEGPWRKKK